MDKATQLRIALTVAGKTLTQFAGELNVSLTTIYAVLEGKTTSARVSGAIDRFTTEHLRDLSEQLVEDFPLRRAA